MVLNHYQYQLLYCALIEYQKRYENDPITFRKCDDLIDVLYPFVYTQQQEQPT